MTKTIHIKLTVMALIWAGGMISAKEIAPQAGPFTICFLRFLIAASLAALLVRQRGGGVAWDKALVMLVAGAAFLGVLCYNYFLFSGIRFIEAGRGAVIVSLVPVVLAVSSMILFRERWGGLKILGILASVCGAAVVITRGDLAGLVSGGIGRGEVMMLGCVLCAAGFSLMSKLMLTRLQPLQLMACVSAVGTALVAGPAWLELQNSPLVMGSSKFVLNLLYLAIGPSVIAYLFYCDAIKSVGAARASQYMNLMPVFSVILAMLFLGEQLSGSLIVGGGLVMAGLFLTNAGAS